MEAKDEGIAFPPVPLVRERIREALPRGVQMGREDTEPRCEACGSRTMASHCRRICPRCGFMTGCSEGIKC